MTIETNITFSYLKGIFTEFFSSGWILSISSAFLQSQRMHKTRVPQRISNKESSYIYNTLRDRVLMNFLSKLQFSKTLFKPFTCNIQLFFFLALKYRNLDCKAINFNSLDIYKKIPKTLTILTLNSKIKKLTLNPYLNWLQ